MIITNIEKLGLLRQVSRATLGGLGSSPNICDNNSNLLNKIKMKTNQTYSAEKRMEATAQMTTIWSHET